jgi:multisubunit Na+/H+ antiporter MnhE subunit
MKRFLLHIVLALAWMLMFESFDPYTLLAGLVIAHLLIAMLGRPPGTQRFRANPWRWVRFAAYFVKILVIANWQVARFVLAPAMPIHPRLIRYDVTGMTAVEITAFASAITLTPGTLAVDLSADDRLLYIHCINAPDRARALRELDELRDRLMTEVFA